MYCKYCISTLSLLLALVGDSRAQQAIQTDKSLFVPPVSVTGPLNTIPEPRPVQPPVQQKPPVPEGNPVRTEPAGVTKPEIQKSDDKKPIEPVKPITHFPDGAAITRPIVEAMAATSNWALVVVDWKSKCPHADLDLHLVASDGTQLFQGGPTKPWARLFHSGDHRPNHIPLVYQAREVAVIDRKLCTQIWLDVFFSHDHGVAKISMFRDGKWSEEEVAFSKQPNLSNSPNSVSRRIRIANWALD
jgi:hypothetical protein